ncbi:MAG: PEP-CTERM sorting domain-containing protein [Bryobacteraceae bacterium]
MKFIMTFFVFGALLSAGTVDVTLLNYGNPAVKDSQGIYVGPYTLSVNGMNYTALCVDNKDWSALNTPWFANLTSVGSSNLTDTYNASKGIEYQEDAYLYTLITQASGATRINIQHAAWDIINYSITSSTSLSGLNLFSGDAAYINQATQNYNTSGLNFANFEIVSSASCYRDQEFIIAKCDAPEPASFALLGAGLLMAGASRAWRRRRQIVRAEPV